MNRFEDSIAWQKARGMAAAGEPNPGAAVSVMANIAEGWFDLYGDNQFHHALTIAKGSCAEVRSHLYIAHDIGYFDQSQFDRLGALNVGSNPTRLSSPQQRRQRRRAQDRRPQ